MSSEGALSSTWNLEVFENLEVALAFHRLILDENGVPQDYVFLEVNTAFENFTGLKRDDILNQKVTDIIPGFRDADPDLVLIYGNVAMSGEPFQDKFWFAPLERWYKVSVFRTAPLHFAVQFVDITEEKVNLEKQKQISEELQAANQQLNANEQQLRASEQQLRAANQQLKANEQQLRAGEQQLRAANQQLVAGEKQLKFSNEKLQASEVLFRGVVSNSLAIIFAIDRDGIFRISEGKSLEVLGLKPGQVVGMNALEVYADFPKILEGIRTALSGKFFQALTQVGEVFFDIIYSPWKNSAGEVIGLIGMAVDITARVQAEKKTAQIERQLVQSEKLYAIGQLAGGVAHDFNNQLSGIMGNVEVLREFCERSFASDTDNGENAGQVNQALDQIMDCCRNSASLTRKLLAFARKGKYEVRRVDLHETIDSVIELLRHSLNKNIVIRKEIKAARATVSGDSGQLQNAILNIAINSSDAMPSGGELLFVSRLTELDSDFFVEQGFEAKPGTYVEILVKDTGTGMDEELISHIFEPFFSTKESGKGVGLGLSSAHGTFLNHGGLLLVESEVGRGTVFRLLLPCNDSGDCRTPRTKFSVSSCSRKILFIDDEEIICSANKMLLERRGFRVAAFTDPALALEEYDSDPKSWDLVILDMIMPGMTGREVFEAIREKYSDAKVLICSGYSIEGDAQTLLDSGAVDFIQKPYQVGELVTRIQEILEV